MGELIAHITYMVAVFPFIIFTEATDMFSNFLKERNIYHSWDRWHSLLVLLILLLAILYTARVF